MFKDIFIIFCREEKSLEGGRDLKANPLSEKMIVVYFSFAPQGLSFGNERVEVVYVLILLLLLNFIRTGASCIRLSFSFFFLV